MIFCLNRNLITINKDLLLLYLYIKLYIWSFKEKILYMDHMINQNYIYIHTHTLVANPYDTI